MILREKKQSIRDPHDVVDIIRTILSKEHEIDRMKEHAWIIALNTKSIIQYIELVSLGCLSYTVVHPREVYRLAVMKAAASVILVHNHPSGDPEPSREDIEITKRIVEAGEILNIQCLDHVIVCDESFSSLKKRGII